MEQNLIDFDLSPEDLTFILAALDSAGSKLSFLISLSDDQKKKIFKPGEGYSPFIDLGVDVINAHPEIMSGTFNAASFKRDVNLKKGLEQIHSKIEVLKKGIEDTLTAAASDSFIGALEIYDEGKSKESKIPGLSILVDKMRSYFPRKRGLSVTPLEQPK